jgi:hypothetical protein
MHRFTLKCPKCSDISTFDSAGDPTLFCGECLMHDMEVVKLEIVRVSLLAPKTLRSH